MGTRPLQAAAAAAGGDGAREARTGPRPTRTTPPPQGDCVEAVNDDTLDTTANQTTTTTSHRWCGRAGRESHDGKANDDEGSASTPARGPPRPPTPRPSPQRPPPPSQSQGQVPITENMGVLADSMKDTMPGDMTAAEQLTYLECTNSQYAPKALDVGPAAGRDATHGLKEIFQDQWGAVSALGREGRPLG
jgi:hypothetical protein